MYKESAYYKLYDVTARALKRMDHGLRVGVPATALAAWLDRFLAHCDQANVPVDFAATDVYVNDTAQDIFVTSEVVKTARAS